MHVFKSLLIVSVAGLSLGAVHAQTANSQQQAEALELLHKVMAEPASPPAAAPPTAPSATGAMAAPGRMDTETEQKAREILRQTTGNNGGPADTEPPISNADRQRELDRIEKEVQRGEAETKAATQPAEPTPAAMAPAAPAMAPSAPDAMPPQDGMTAEQEQKARQMLENAAAMKQPAVNQPRPKAAPNDEYLPQVYVAPATPAAATAETMSPAAEQKARQMLETGAVAPAAAPPVQPTATPPPATTTTMQPVKEATPAMAAPTPQEAAAAEAARRAAEAASQKPAPAETTKPAPAAMAPPIAGPIQNEPAAVGMTPQAEQNARAMLENLMNQGAAQPQAMKPTTETGSMQAIEQNARQAEQKAREKSAAEAPIQTPPPTVSAAPKTSPTPPAIETQPAAQMTKQQRLDALLEAYKHDQVSPAEYHRQRAKILAGPE